MDFRKLNEQLEKYILKEEVSKEYKHNLKVAEDAIKQILLPEVKQEVSSAKLHVHDNCFVITFEVVKRHGREIQNAQQIATEKENIKAAKKEIEKSLKNTVAAIKEQLPKCNIDTDITDTEVMIEISGEKLYKEIKE